MYDPINPVFYHFWSSAFVGSLAFWSTSSTASRSSLGGHSGSTNWISSRRLLSLFLLSVWTHIFADVIEHGGPPSIVEGLSGAVLALSHAL